MNLSPIDPSATLSEVIDKVNEIITVIKDQPLRLDSLGSGETDDLTENIGDLNN